MIKRIMCCIMMLFIISGCQKRENNEKGIERKCTFEKLEIPYSYELEAKNENSEISKVILKFSYPYSYIGVSNSSDLNENQRKELEESLKKQMQFEDAEIEYLDSGFDLIIKSPDNSVREYITDDIEQSIIMKDIVKYFEKNGATCR